MSKQLKLAHVVWLHVLEILAFNAFTNLSENIVAQTYDKAFFVEIFWVRIVDDCLHVWLYCKTSHRLDDSLASTTVPFWCSGIDEHQGSDFLFYQSHEFVTSSSHFRSFHANIIHEVVLFWRNSSAANCNFSFSLRMLGRIKFFMLFPRIFFMAVFITKFFFHFICKVFRPNVDSWVKFADLFGFEFERLANNSGNRSAIFSNTAQNGDFLFFIADKSSRTVQRIDPQTELLNFDKDLFLFEGIRWNQSIGIDFVELHGFTLLSYFFVNFVISLKILFANDSQTWVLLGYEPDNGMLNKIVSLNNETQIT